MMPKRWVAAVCGVALWMLMGATPALAIPSLQLYIEGATYNATPGIETWVIDASPFKLWVLGDVTKGAIFDVKVSLAYFSTSTSNEFGSATLSATTTSLLTDPSTPSAPSGPTETGTSGSPTTVGGSLQDHGIFNDNSCGDADGCIVRWEVLSIGNFTLTDSPLHDLNGSFNPPPFPATTDTGQINAYTVSIPSGWLRVHFDAFGWTVGNTQHQQKNEFAPFSHDAGGASVPEPGTFILLATSLAGLTWWRRRQG